MKDTTNNTCNNIKMQQEHHHCRKKLAHLLFNFGILPEVMSMQPMTVVNNRLWLELITPDGHALLTTAVVWCQSSTGCHTNTWTYF